MQRMSTSDPRRSELINIPYKGKCLFPGEFMHFTGEIDVVEMQSALTPPKQIHGQLASGKAIILAGPYPYVNGVFRYCQHFERGLVGNEKYSNISDRGQRSAAFTAERRQKLHRLLVLAQGDNLLDIQEPPDTAGLQKWLQEPTGDSLFIIPVRRLQRILTDMQRAREGIFIKLLNGTITIFPHVYVPSDQSVPAMFAEHENFIHGKRVLDMGTGTGILALLAAHLGAANVVATDSNPNAVANARLNAERLELSDIVEVRGPANLFDPLKNEIFDVILFNAPWIQGEPKTLYDTANYDPGYQVLDGFLQKVHEHLASDGIILLQYSDVSQRKGENSLGHLEDSITSNGLKIVNRQSITRISRVLGAREHVFLFEIRRTS